MEKKEDISIEQKILEAAEELFLDKGYTRTSTTEIAKKAGCTHAMVHYYFRTKERLFEKIFENKINLFAVVFNGPDLPGETFEDKLRRRIGAHFDILVENPKLPILILTDMTNSAERISLAREAMGYFPEMLFNNLGRELEVEIQKGTVRPISARDLVMNILSLNIFTFVSLPLFSMIINLPDEQKSQFLDHRKQEIIETIIRSLRP